MLRRSPLWKKWLSGLLALLLGFQSLAAGALPCAHAIADQTATEESSCHQSTDVRTQGNADPADSHFSCMKCALAAIASLYDLPGVLSPALTVYSTAPAATPANSHFYRFIPQQPQRPPIS